ncbi:hypothetical protein [Kamptonema formosum]|uniref:hypothetical protein n=1 Tax=Kamptonema formosum TaxID=331992 RepID=UPI000344C35C|nr:hypothetical protein [Oscillatoria sp. PCC 10802]
MQIPFFQPINLAYSFKKAFPISAALAFTVALAPSALAASFADFVFIVDESGSMAGEHSWLGSTIGNLEAALQAKGVGSGFEENRYGLLGFGGYYGGSFYRNIGVTYGSLERSIPVGYSLLGSAYEFANATRYLVSNGSFEDGYSAINYALNNYSFREGAAVNFVLVSDEDRDNGNGSLNFNSILSGLQQKNALLNVVVNHQLTGENGQQAIGADAQGNAFLTDGQGGFTTIASGAGVSYRSFGTTKADYVNLAWATGNSTVSGAAWDLNMLRAGGDTAKSFSAAFVEIKATEALKQTGNGEPTKVPEPTATLGLLGCAAFSIGKQIARKSPQVSKIASE